MKIIAFVCFQLLALLSLKAQYPAINLQNLFDLGANLGSLQGNKSLGTLPELYGVWQDNAVAEWSSSFNPSPSQRLSINIAANPLDGARALSSIKMYMLQTPICVFSNLHNVQIIMLETGYQLANAFVNVGSNCPSCTQNNLNLTATGLELIANTFGSAAFRNVASMARDLSNRLGINAISLSGMQANATIVQDLLQLINQVNVLIPDVYATCDDQYDSSTETVLSSPENSGQITPGLSPVSPAGPSATGPSGVGTSPGTVGGPDPEEPLWGVYASSVITLVTDPDVNPCDITYSVMMMSNTKVAYNVSIGAMVPVATGLTWREAQAMSDYYSVYGDDQPDGVVKLSSCRTDTPSKAPPIGSGGPVVRSAQCNDQQKNGGSTPETIEYDLGQTTGSFRFYYDTKTIPDRIRVFNGQQMIFDSQCVGKAETIQLQLKGSSKIRVVVTPNCNGKKQNTVWEFKVYCPESDDSLAGSSASVTPPAKATSATSPASATRPSGTGGVAKTPAAHQSGTEPAFGSANRADLVVHNNTDATLTIVNADNPDMPEVVVSPTSKKLIPRGLIRGLNNVIAVASRVGGGEKQLEKDIWFSSGQKGIVKEWEIFPEDFGTTFISDRPGTGINPPDSKTWKWPLEKTHPWYGKSLKDLLSRGIRILMEENGGIHASTYYLNDMYGNWLSVVSGIWSRIDWENFQKEFRQIKSEPIMNNPKLYQADTWQSGDGKVKSLLIYRDKNFDPFSYYPSTVYEWAPNEDHPWTGKLARNLSDGGLKWEFEFFSIHGSRYFYRDHDNNLVSFDNRVVRIFDWQRFQATHTLMKRNGNQEIWKNTITGKEIDRRFNVH